MLRVHDIPRLRNAALICAFSGWADAAFAASTAVQHLTTKYSGQIIAEFDPDEVYSYTITRPLTTFTSPGRRTMRWPQLRWIALPLPPHEHDIVVLTGPEPDLRWQACCAVVGQFAQRLGITRALALGAFYAAVPHYGAPLLLGYASDAEGQSTLARLGARESQYEGPTGFLSAVVATLQEVGIPTAACWGGSPNYLSGSANPKLAAALLSVAEGVLGQPIPHTELHAAGREMEAQVDQALRDRPDLVEFIQRLGGEPRAISPEVSPSTPVSPPYSPTSSDELPSAEEVLRNLEEHLRRLRKPPDDQ